MEWLGLLMYSSGEYLKKLFSFPYREEGKLLA